MYPSTYITHYILWATLQSQKTMLQLLKKNRASLTVTVIWPAGIWPLLHSVLFCCFLLCCPNWNFPHGTHTDMTFAVDWALTPIIYLSIPWEIRVAFPKESQLRVRRATQPQLITIVYAVYLCHDHNLYHLLLSYHRLPCTQHVADSPTHKPKPVTEKNLVCALRLV